MVRVRLPFVNNTMPVGVGYKAYHLPPTFKTKCLGSSGEGSIRADIDD